MRKVILFPLLTVGFFLLATILCPFAWSRWGRAIHQRAGRFCRRVYFGVNV